MKRLVLPILFVAILIAAMKYQSTIPPAVLCEPPAVHLGEIEGLVSESLGASEQELSNLPADTRIEKRRYEEPNGHWAIVNLVIGGKSKQSIHRPELCLPSQGNLMMNPHTLVAGDTSWHKLSLANASTSESVGFAYTFFNQAGYRTHAHIKRIFRDIWDRSLYNRIDRWAMVTVVSSHDDDAALGAFLARLQGAIR